MWQYEGVTSLSNIAGAVKVFLCGILCNQWGLYPTSPRNLYLHSVFSRRLILLRRIPLRINI